MRASSSCRAGPAARPWRGRAPWPLPGVVECGAAADHEVASVGVGDGSWRVRSAYSSIVSSTMRQSHGWELWTLGARQASSITWRRRSRSACSCGPRSRSRCRVGPGRPGGQRRHAPQPDAESEEHQQHVERDHATQPTWRPPPRGAGSQNVSPRQHQSERRRMAMKTSASRPYEANSLRRRSVGRSPGQRHEPEMHPAHRQVEAADHGPPQWRRWSRCRGRSRQRGSHGSPHLTFTTPGMVLAMTWAIERSIAGGGSLDLDVALGHLHEPVAHAPWRRASRRPRARSRRRRVHGPSPGRCG